MAFALSSMQVTSTAFGNHQAIPAKHTGEGRRCFPLRSLGKGLRKAPKGLR
ncbi:hypothetical protein HAALTHF_43920n [Vreelandella aquamarina]|nr:hypothetical protein HAALTHF_43920n [Halomonas axialensis]